VAEAGRLFEADSERRPYTAGCGRSSSNKRREVGVVVKGARTLSRLVDTFEADWSAKEMSDNPEATAELSVLNPLVNNAVREVVEKTGGGDLDPQEIQESVQKAVKEAVRERVHQVGHHRRAGTVLPALHEPAPRAPGRRNGPGRRRYTRTGSR